MYCRGRLIVRRDLFAAGGMPEEEEEELQQLELEPEAYREQGGGNLNVEGGGFNQEEIMPAAPTQMKRAHRRRRSSWQHCRPCNTITHARIPGFLRTLFP